MDRLQVDHQVPEAFLRQLRQMFHTRHGETRAKNIANELKLDWRKRDEIDSSQTNEGWSTSMRHRYYNYEVEEDLDFEGRLYEVLSDVNNLWLLCPECNGKKGKTDKLLKVNYEALNEYYDDGGPKRQSMMDTFLSKWIGTDYYWDPEEVEQVFDIPDSPMYSDPDIMEL